jgi:hypothetical protein
MSFTRSGTECNGYVWIEPIAAIFNGWDNPARRLKNNEHEASLNHVTGKFLTSVQIHPGAPGPDTETSAGLCRALRHHDYLVFLFLHLHGLVSGVHGPAPWW